MRTQTGTPIDKPKPRPYRMFSRKRPRVLILDSHSGMALAHQAMLKELGIDACVLKEIIVWGQPTRSIYASGRSPSVADTHFTTFCIRHPIFAARRAIEFYRFRLMGLRSSVLRLYVQGREHALRHLFRHSGCNANDPFVRNILNTRQFRDYFSQFDVLICTFPPGLFLIAKVIADEQGQRIILNMGHRFNIRTPANREFNEHLKKELLALIRDDRHTAGAATHYDQLYTRHYLSGLDERLPQNQPPVLGLKMFHIRPYPKQRPASNTILLARAAWAPMPWSSDQINEAYRTFCKRRSVAGAYTFKTMGEAVPKIYQYDDLHQFAAVVVLPYSSFSITGLELYECNLPHFYPDVEFILRHEIAIDCQLYPLYTDKKTYARMEPDVNDPDSPNGDSVEARRKWLKHFHGYYTGNAIIFSDFDDLFAKVHQCMPRFAEISGKMYEENLGQRTELLERWRRLLGLPEAFQAETGRRDWKDIGSFR